MRVRPRHAGRARDAANQRRNATVIKSGLKARLAAGEVVVGPFYKLNCPSLVEMFGYVGLDFIIIDNEHSNFGYADMENLIRAADGVGLPTVIRVPSAAEEHLIHALDSGASGIQIPSLTTVAQVKAALPHTKYYPQGIRGMNTAQRGAHFGFMDKFDFFKASNDEGLVVVHVENTEMAADVEELCRVPELDVLFVGPGDLSQAVGKPMQVNDPEVVAIAERVITTARRHGKYAGVWVGSVEDARKYVAMGAQFLGFSADVGLIAGALKGYGKTVAELRALPVGGGA
jgi:4-hydroxy-2-oxoheptanedioate aldolase